MYIIIKLKQFNNVVITLIKVANKNNSIFERKTIAFRCCNYLNTSNKYFFIFWKNKAASKYKCCSHLKELHKPIINLSNF